MSRHVMHWVRAKEEMSTSKGIGTPCVNKWLGTTGFLFIDHFFHYLFLLLNTYRKEIDTKFWDEIDTKFWNENQ